MATFIPERVGPAGARSIHLKRALNALDDACVVRSPVKREGWAPDFFVQHPQSGWLAIAVSDAPFSALAVDQLFGSDERAAFDNLVTGFANFPDVPDAGNEPVEKLIVMWACRPEEVRMFAGQYLTRFGIRLWSRDDFSGIGARLERLLSPICAENEQSLMARYFPEVEVHASCTTRRHFFRDNSARLHRFFLDPQQEWAAKLDLTPPQEQAEVTKDLSVRLVNGVAGSGKTLIAISRAMLLAEMYPEQQVLVLIHNTPVVADIKAKLLRLHGRLPGNLEISTFSAWAHRQWRGLYQAYLKMPKSPRQVEDLIAHFRGRWPALKQTTAQLREEFDFINESLTTDADYYSAVSRVGRGFALRTGERALVWELFQVITSSLRESGQRLWSAVPFEICLAKDHRRLEKYDHVLIDEAQFFAPSWFQTVRLAMRQGSSLFLCADPNQGFMKNRLSWKSVGIDVSGRTKKLRRSYRTTRAIMAAASSVLARHAGGDPDDFLVPDLSGMALGSKPVVIYTDSPQDSVDRLLNELSTIVDTDATALGDSLVICGEQVHKKPLYEGLCKCFGADNVWWLNKDEHKKEPPKGYQKDYLRLANLDTATGLEAGIVFLVGLENLLYDDEAFGRRINEESAAGEEKARKLYMAMTRAGKHLILLSSQKLAASLEGVFDELLDEPRGVLRAKEQSSWHDAKACESGLMEGYP